MTNASFSHAEHYKQFPRWLFPWNIPSSEATLKICFSFLSTRSDISTSLAKGYTEVNIHSSSEQLSSLGRIPTPTPQGLVWISMNNKQTKACCLTRRTSFPNNVSGRSLQFQHNNHKCFISALCFLGNTTSCVLLASREEQKDRCYLLQLLKDVFPAMSVFLKWECITESRKVTERCSQRREVDYSVLLGDVSEAFEIFQAGS